MQHWKDKSANGLPWYPKRKQEQMTDHVVAQKAPFAVEVEAGKSYFWCSCGRSANQPFCDGSHKDTGVTLVKYTAEKDGRAFFWGCKTSANATMCDGNHSTL